LLLFFSFILLRGELPMRSRAFRAAMLVGALWLLSPSRASGQDAVLQRDINEAIDRGVAYLRRIQGKDGRWPHVNIGATALAGLTLLESGASAEDEAVQKAAKALREECIPLTHIYSVAAAILFFDRLDDAADEPLIESLALRLMVTQNRYGGWSYKTWPPLDAEVARLNVHYKQIEANKGNREPRKAARKPGDPSPLAPQIRIQLAKLFQEGLTEGGYGDNSNTQFAMLALWVARRHGMPVERSLALVEARFRKTQHPIGTWGYLYGPDGSIDVVRERFGSVYSMTCAGLLGLAVGHEAISDKNPRKPAARELTKDPQVRAALGAVAAFIGNPQVDKSKVLILGKGMERGYYFLWTLERMAVIYSLKTIGNKDWYAWGAQILVANQQPDGSWHGDTTLHGMADTCFALLFLKRANVAQDLTASLKGKVNDPGKVSPQILLMIGKQDGTAGGPTGNVPAAKPDGQAKNDATDTGTTPAALTAEAAKLCNEVVDAAPDQQDALLKKLRDTPGPAYTHALAGAISRLRGTAKTRARLALAQRFQKLDAEVLRLHLRAIEPEMRRAAAVAAGAKKARELIPDLIILLEDRETTVLQAAHAGLRQVTDQDFGPELDASPAERAAAVEAWRKWWKQQ